MLVDRKFYYPVATSAPTPPPVMGNAEGNPRFNRTPTRWWAPIGGNDAVRMDNKSPYTGDQTPLVKLGGREPHGFSQSGIAVRKGKSYTGRIGLAGPPVRWSRSRSSGATNSGTVRLSPSPRSVRRNASSRCVISWQPISMMQL